MTFLSNLFRRKPAPQKIEPLARRTLAKRAKSAEDNGEDLALTEDPEKQRARHRLIGAATLVLIAVIGLPQILDQQPKPVANDITVQIVSNLPNPAAGVLNAEPDKKPPVEVKAEPKPELAPAAPASPPVAAPKPASPAPATSNAPNKSLGLAPGEELVSTSKEPAGAADAKVAANGKFVIQIGAFASEERANGWVAKLKENKIPYYVLTRNNAEGVKLYLLRAGPFSEREAAESAEKRIRSLGLSPRIVELNKS
ncbi:SPOR domain-containing protein [Polynucleobacter sp. HIN7]|uniref:SPOR domain-containing protein n=1 Tax=Polynucleobacter sp. HIN7 TaxID=3047866 RepID=UPI00257486F3|nr:SPOR domain-containing protein [Polynucleobacter sp. HIN7]BEI37246.1 SPOR domain-containing protein [Polynucleobacter sp. HIN7]